jgi:glycosyltransferase involved in cell wall biosynthesis
MRIVFLGDGSMNHVRRWAGYFHDRGHEVYLLSFEDTDECAFPAKRLEKRLPTNLLGYISRLGDVKREIERFKPDIINALYVSGYGLLGAKSGFRPLVISALGSDLLVDYRSSFIHKLQIGHAMKKADLVTTDADALTKIALSIGVSPDIIIKAYFGIDPVVFHAGHDSGESTPDGGDRPAIISTRNLWPVYDVGLLVRAAPAVLDECNVRFMICGDGPELCRLKDLADKLGVSGSFSFKGKLPPDEIAGELRAAAAYVSTSRSDSTSVSLLEAMACGAPPVVADIAANREWIVDGSNGLLFPPGDEHALASAIIRIIRDSDFAAKARESNFQTVQERGLWIPNMERVEKAFEELIGRWRHQ